MIRLRTLLVMLAAAAAAPAALAQTQSANSDTTFSSHGDPQPKQNSATGAGATQAHTAMSHRARKPSMSKGTSTAHASGMSAQQPANMTANTH